MAGGSILSPFLLGYPKMGTEKDLAVFICWMQTEKSCSRGEFPIQWWKGALSSIVDDTTRMSHLEYSTHFSLFIVKTEKIDMWSMWRRDEKGDEKFLL